MGFFDRFRKSKKEVTPGGSEIYRHAASDGGFTLPEITGRYADEVTAHFEALFPGRKSRVIHEIVSDFVHIDVHVMWPTAEQSFFILFTTGMSDKPMTIPRQVPAASRPDLELAELFLMLPGDWPLKENEAPTPEVYWPINLMRSLARLPHQFQSWLGYGHTIPSSADYDAYAPGVPFTAAVLLGGGDGRLGHLNVRDGRRLNLLCIIPAYKEEVEYKLKYGMAALSTRFQEHEVGPLLDVHRPNLCADFTEVLDS